jgi:sulfatase maturation enzyme AslB (radical SAM superfamily)
MTERQKEFYKKGYDYMSKKPIYISEDKLTEEQARRLTSDQHFCILPWVHTHAFPDGRTYPCCLADYWHPIGDLRKNSLAEIWNQDGYKTMRKNMLEDKPCTECTKCYEQEASGFFSMRNEANRNLGHYIEDVDKTLEDGTHPEFKIRYWDVRFSNLCNFSCRSCGPIFSSNWYKDHVKLYNRKPDVLGREMAVVEYAGGTEDSMIEQMEPHIPFLEQVYFAGGEPLIMKEHYYLLDRLLELDNTNVRLIYNTNFSEMRFKDKHVYDYWKKFETVNVGASLDASGARAELIRKGADWQQTVDNRRRMMEETPHVDFYISATVSAMNILHVLDFHREWVELGLIEPKDFNINICQSPEWYRVDIFPKWFKDEVIIPAYKKHIEWLDPQDKLRRATVGFESVINFLSANDRSDLWPRFVEEIDKLDTLRGEDFWATFPEYDRLR